MPDLVAELFREWMPHGYCVAWDGRVVGLIVVGEALTALAYALIPLALVRQVRRHRAAIGATAGPRMVGIYGWFAAFIAFCGVGHLWAIVLLWHGVYLAAACWTLGTGIVSLITVDRVFRSQEESAALWRTPDGLAAIRRAVERIAEASEAIVARRGGGRDE